MMSNIVILPVPGPFISLIIDDPPMVPNVNLPRRHVRPTTWGVVCLQVPQGPSLLYRGTQGMMSPCYTKERPRVKSTLWRPSILPYSQEKAAYLI
jgi:hypothetical protein